MKKINCTLIAILSFSLSSIGFAQQDKQMGKKNVNTLSTKVHSSFKKSSGAVFPQGWLVPYTFSYSTGTYTDLANPTSLNAGFTWDDPTFSIPFGFNFTLWSNTISTISIDGWWLGGVLTPASSGIQPFIMYSPDLIDRASDTINSSGMPGSVSPISYEVTGPSGNKILKVEWKNAGFYDDVMDDNVSTDYVNLQMWMYEGSNDIEIRFGPSSISQPSLVYSGDPGPAIGVGVYDYNVDTIVFFCLQGNPSSPTDTTIDINGWVTLAGSPSSGIIYKFTWSNTTGITHSTIENKYMDVFPNPSIGKFTLALADEVKPSQIEIYNVLGEKVYTNVEQFINSTIDLSTRPKGIYFLKVKTADKLYTEKVVVQ